MLAELMRTKYAVAVGGAHGKTTTTSMTAAVLTEGGLDPTVVVGGRIRATGTGARLGAGDYLVAEADESDGSFLKLYPSVAVVTNIDREHLSHFGSMAALREAFAAFIDRVPFYGAAILCIDDPQVAALGAEATRRVRTYGFSDEAEVRASEVETVGLEARFRVHRGDTELGTVRLGMPGHHNIQNSLAAITVGLEFGLPWPVIRDGLQGFGGVSRRFEIRGEHGGVMLVDDYGHHPTEIAAVLATARAAWPDKQLVVVFQPHRYTRTIDLHDRFATAFGEADRLILCPIYAAGEEAKEGVTSEWLAEAVGEGSALPVTVTGTLDEAASMLINEARPGEVWITLGAGDITRLAEDWARRVQAAEV
jgi:UDP-N-acetylmuramate--alanine ligase